MEIQELYKLYQQHPCITTDSRDCPEGSIFLALKGEKFDGNQYAEGALQKGCAYAIVDNPEVVKDNRYLLVDDTLQTYKDLAREHRRQFNIPVIGITGTNGKTTTKELIKAVLPAKYNVLATEGNFNNDVGVPKTLLRLNKEHEIAIIEMGASHPGDIKTLVETAEPTCGLITNVGRAHLQGFGSFEGVVKTKGELYDYLRTREDGLVFVNADNDYLCDMLTDEMWCTPYSTDPDKQYACISGEVISCDPLLKFRWRKPLMELEETGASQKWHKVQTNLIGAYNIDNLLAAIAVGINFNVDRKQIDHALENYVPTNNRSQLTETPYNRSKLSSIPCKAVRQFPGVTNLYELTAVIRESWSRDTIHDAFWDSECPAFHQDDVTARLLRDMCGLETGVVQTQQGKHVFNCLGSTAIDLTGGLDGEPDLKDGAVSCDPCTEEADYARYRQLQRNLMAVLNS